MRETGTILDQIVARRRTHLPALKSELKALENETELVVSQRSLFAALGGGKRGRDGKAAGFILECKAASPSLGMIRPDYRPAEIAQIYSRYAAAISVLCEPDYFQGAFAHLRQVRANTDLPVLCKDFIVDETQIYLARRSGADAILLMLSVLDDAEYQRFATLAEELQLDILTEVSNREELDRALALDAKIIGINNRDLRDLSIDTNRTPQLAQLIPDDRVVVSESGIRAHETAVRLSPDVSGFLVGSQLTSQADIDLACRDLLYGPVKVCGITSAEAAQAVAKAGASYAGFIAVESSPRFVTAAQARELMRQMRAGKEPGENAAVPKTVVVTREMQAEAVAQLVKDYEVQVVQLHAPLSDPQTEVAQLQLLRAHPDLAEVELWRALDMSAEQALATLKTLTQDNSPVNRVLVDSSAGGSGERFAAELIPAELRGRVIVAGGLDVAAAKQLRALGFSAVDFNSRLEFPERDEQGIARKDPALITAALQALRV